MAKLTPLKAIREKCLQCCCGSYKEVRECEVTDCALYAFRHGKRPQKHFNEGVPLENLLNKKTIS